MITEKNSQHQIIKVFRYMWLVEGSENMCIKVISDVEEMHKKFIEALKADKRVIKAARVYLHEYDVAMIEFYEGLVDKEKEEEEK